MEMKFKDVINNIKDKEIWKNKSEGRRLKSIECHNDIIIFNLDETHKDFGVHLDDKFILERTKYDTGFAMQELKKGKIIESVYDGTKFKIENNHIYATLYNSTWYKNEWGFSEIYIMNDWYIED